MKSIGNQLKKVRLERGLSQREVAEALGVEQNYISRYESGQRQMDVQTLEALANILNVRFVQRFEYDGDEEMGESASELFDEIESTKTGYDIAMKVYPIQKQDEVLVFFYVGEFSASVYFGKSLPNSTEPFLTKEMKHLAIEQGGDYIGFLPYEWENQVPLIEFIRNDHHHFDTFEETEVFHTLPISIQQDMKKRFARWFNLQEEEQLILLPYDEFEFILKEA